MIIESKSKKISVLLVTFNHEKHIRQALDSLFGQKYDGSIELVVADDASTDSTIKIVKEYLYKDSRFDFVFLNNSKNVGITQNYKRGFAACTSEYVAILEGDDYWISPHKLEFQNDFLDAHWECDLCAANYFIFNEKSREFHLRLQHNVNREVQLFSARDLIADNVVGNFSTCMYRKSGLDSLPQELFELKSYDWIVNICIARDKMIGFLGQPLSVYRLHSSGTWTQLSEVDKLNEQLEVLPAYNKLTEEVFHDSFVELSKRLEYSISASSKYTLVLSRRRKIDYLPPFFVVLLRLLTPPALKDFIGRVIRKLKRVSND